MKKTKYRILFFSVILILIFSLFIIGDLSAVPEQFKMIKELEGKETVTPEADEAIERPKVEYKAGSLRDPFQKDIPQERSVKQEAQPSETKQSQPPALTVQGLIWGGNFPQAIINNKVVKTGDSIEGARILSIDKEGITVFYDGNEYNLSPPAAVTGASKKF